LTSLSYAQKKSLPSGTYELQRLANGEVQADLARSYGVSQATISRLQA